METGYKVLKDSNQKTQRERQIHTKNWGFLELMEVASKPSSLSICHYL